MPISVSCVCGAAFRLKDEYAGKRLKCPKCSQAIQAPALEEALVGAVAGGPGMPPPLPDGPVGTLAYQAPAVGSGVFDRDKFLLRQKMLSLNQKYTVSDEQQRPIAFVLRPAYVGRMFLTALAIIGTLLVGAIGLSAGLMFASEMLGKDNPVLVVVGILAFLLLIAAVVFVAVLIYPLRHVQFYSNETGSEKLLDVLQDGKWQIPVATYTLRDADGQVIAKFRKNYLWNLIRRQWQIYSPDGTIICRAMEDSMILSLLRRFLGPMMGLLRTNFIICRGDSDEIIGEFNRKFTIVDRYVLDMGGDPGRTLDRRICLALGVMLDTGERR